MFVVYPVESMRKCFDTANLSNSIFSYKPKIDPNYLQIYSHFSNIEIPLLFLFYEKSSILETIIFPSVDNTGFLKIVF